MKVLRAACAGTCHGVQRALDLANAAVSEHGRIVSMGPLIHNPAVVRGLESRGLQVVSTPEEVDGGAVIVRSHGTTPEVLRELGKRSDAVIDATCPHVLKAQKAAARLASQGRTVLIVGEESHPEVQGLAAWARDAGGKVVIVGDADFIPVDLSGPVGVVAQTTLPKEVFEKVVCSLTAAGFDVEAVDTVCCATSDRQAAARELASRVDCMVVVGGKNSSNTRRLFEICSLVAPRSYLVESVSDLSASQFEGVEVVGVTAGASTPEEQICAVEDCLRCW